MYKTEKEILKNGRGEVHLIKDSEVLEITLIGRPKEMYADVKEVSICIDHTAEKPIIDLFEKEQADKFPPERNIIET